jgi:hypothetical protein
MALVDVVPLSEANKSEWSGDQDGGNLTLANHKIARHRDTNILKREREREREYLPVAHGD